MAAPVATPLKNQKIIYLYRRIAAAWNETVRDGVDPETVGYAITLLAIGMLKSGAGIKAEDMLEELVKQFTESYKLSPKQVFTLLDAVKVHG